MKASMDHAMGDPGLASEDKHCCGLETEKGNCRSWWRGNIAGMEIDYLGVDGSFFGKCCRMLGYDARQLNRLAWLPIFTIRLTVSSS